MLEPHVIKSLTYLGLADEINQEACASLYAAAHKQLKPLMLQYNARLILQASDTTFSCDLGALYLRSLIIKQTNDP